MAKAKRSASEIARMMMGGAAPARKLTPKPAAKAAKPKPAKPATAPRAPASELDELLAIWRETPARELGDLIVELGAAEQQPAEWLPTAPPRANQITTLLGSLLAKGSVQGRERLEAMVDWPTDPRIDRWVAERYVEVPFTSTGARPFWTRMVPLASRITDPVASELLVKARKKISKSHFLTPYLDRIRNAIGEVPDVALPEATRARIAEVRVRLAKQAEAAKPRNANVSAELLAAVLAKPDDDQLRLVLGDALQEAGDPRGELIAIQMAAHTRALTADEKQREKQILQKHRKQLLGELDAVLKPEVTFVKGFLARCALKQSGSNALDVAIKKTAGNPLWATVEHIEGGGDYDVVRHKVMRSLRSIAKTDVEIEWLAKHTRLEALAGEQVLDSWLPVLADPKAFPKLRTLDVVAWARHAKQLLASPVARRLDKLALRMPVQGDSDAEVGLVAAAVKLKLPELALQIQQLDQGAWFRFVRDGDAPRVSISVPSISSHLEERVWRDVERVLGILPALRPSRVELEKNFRSQPYARSLADRVAALTP